MEENPLAIEMAENAGDEYTVGFVGHYAVYFLLMFGEVEAAEKQSAILMRQAQRVRSPALMTRTYHLFCSINQYKGRWNEARSWIHKAMAISPKVTSAIEYLHCNLARLEYETGNIPEGQAHIAKLCAQSSETVHSVMAALAVPLVVRISNDLKLLDTAREIALEVIRTRKIPLHSVPGKMALAMIAVLEEDTDTAAKLYVELNKPDYKCVWPWGSYSVSRLLGNLCRIMGDLDSGAARFEEACELCKSAGFLPELAWTCLDYALLLMEHDEKPLSTKVESLLDEGASIARELGMPPLLGKIEEEKEGRRSQKSHIKPYGLTRRELEVLQLLARGRTNQEIALELFISENTVVNHISSIFRKTETSNRTEAAVFANRENLL
jgi:DNA-binding CsgD family transcriptional regulator